MSDMNLIIDVNHLMGVSELWLSRRTDLVISEHTVFLELHYILYTERNNENMKVSCR